MYLHINHFKKREKKWWRGHDTWPSSGLHNCLPALSLLKFLMSRLHFRFQLPHARFHLSPDALARFSLPSEPNLIIVRNANCLRCNGFCRGDRRVDIPWSARMFLCASRGGRCASASSCIFPGFPSRQRQGLDQACSEWHSRAVQRVGFAQQIPRWWYSS